jgi:cobalt-zinc-cadmium efflux system outer membrane protein
MTELRTLLPGVPWLLPVVLLCAGAHPGEAQTLPAPRPVTEAGVPAAPATPPALGLADLLRLSLEQNPGLRQAGFEIDAAQGRAVQAGLYPNPTLNFTGEEIGRKGGIHTLPQLSQEIVMGGKRGLSRSVAEREVDQAQLGLLRQRYALLTTVRQGYFDVLGIQRRIEVLDELVKLATQSYENAQKLLEAKQIAELDLLPFQVELERLRADAEAARREQAAGWGRLAAVMGVPDLPPTPLTGSLEAAFPDYTFDLARAAMLEVHPEIRAAQVGITRAQLTVEREQAQAIPNVTLSAGYQRNFNDREDQATYQVSVPLPVWNRNQGSIRAAQAELGRAIQEVTRVQNDLIGRLWTAFGQYAAARQRAERYRTAILPNATRAYRLSQDAFRGGQFEYLRVLQAQRAAAEANLEYLRALGDAWRAASEIAGLLLEEHWPLSILGPCEAFRPTDESVPEAKTTHR